MSETPQPHDGERNASDMLADFPLDVEVRELYLRLVMDGAIWAREQPADDGRLVAYALALAEPAAPAADDSATVNEEPHAAPPTHTLPPGSSALRTAGWKGNVGALIAAVAVVALFSATLLRLSPLATRSPSDTRGASTPQITTTATSAPTMTATVAPTATSTPTPQPTEAPLVPFAPYLVKQPDGKTISEYLIRNGTNAQCSPDYLNFQVLVKFTHSNPGTITFEWRFYDGANPLPDPSTAGFELSYGPAPGDYTPTSDEVLLPSNGSDFQVSMNFAQPPQYSSTPRWGAQLVITAVNGNTLATPIASDIIELAMPAC